MPAAADPTPPPQLLHEVLEQRQKSSGGRAAAQVKSRYVQPIVEILAKRRPGSSTFRSRFVAAMTRTSALEHPRAAEALKFPLLEHPQEFRLHGGAHLAHVRPETASSGRLLEPSARADTAPVKAPFS